MEPIVKLIIGVPKENEEELRLALGEAGAGKIGNYDYCSFVTPGVGHFRPLKGTKPHIGEEGKIEDVEEVQIQTVCYEKDLPAILKAMRAAHPYEEIAYDIIPLLNHRYDKHVGKKQ